MIKSVDVTPPVAIGQEPEAERVSVWELPAVVNATVPAELSQVEEVSEAVAEGVVRRAVEAKRGRGKR